MTKTIMAILCSLSLLCHAADPMLIKSAKEQSEQPTATEPMDVDIEDPTEDNITLISGNQKCVVPKEIATAYSQTIRNKIELANKFNQPTEIITLGEPITPEALKVIINLMTEAHKILIDKPISAKGSYVELSKSQVFNELNEQRLASIMLEGLFLQLDERIQKAVALKIVQLKTRLSISTRFISISLEQEYPDSLLPYIVQQYYLITGLVPQKWENDLGDGISVRDLLVHNKVPSMTKTADGKLRLSLMERNLGSLDGLTDLPNRYQLQMLDLSKNKLTSLPPEIFNTLRQLKVLNLSHNQLTSLPLGIFNALNQLEWLDLSNNQLDDETKQWIKERYPHAKLDE